MIEVNVIGMISFDNKTLPVYRDADYPLFKASDVAELLGYPSEDKWKIYDMVQNKNKIVSIVPDDHRGKRVSAMINEAGLYDVLCQSDKTTAKKWRVVIEEQLINNRRDKGNNVIEEFDDWDHMIDDFFWDDDGHCIKTALDAHGDPIEIQVK